MPGVRCATACASRPCIVCSDARPLRLPDRRRLARPRRATTSSKCPPTDDNEIARRRARRGAARRRSTAGTAHRLHRRHDGHDRRLRPGRPGRHRRAARRAGRRVRTLDYVPHVHADAVIGWAWCVFNDYDFEANPLGFRRRTVRALAGTRPPDPAPGLADSIGIDFHKTGFAPYISSLSRAGRPRLRSCLARDATRTCRTCSSPARPSRHVHAGDDAPGSGSVAALANLRLFGKHGLQALARAPRRDGRGPARAPRRPRGDDVLNRDNFGPVTLFRVYPDGVDTFSDPAAGASDPACREHAARAQRVQPPHLRAASRRGAGGPRRRDLADRLLPRDRLRRADRRRSSRTS